MTLDIKPVYEVEYIDNNGHFYIMNGVKYPSVTSVLGIIGGDKTQALMGWAKKVSIEFISKELKEMIGKDIKIDDAFIDNIGKVGKQRPKWELEKAGNFGNRAHDAIDNFIIDGRLPTDDEIRPVFDGFIKWTKEHKFNIISGDMTVGSKKHGFGGRMDALAIDEEGNYIILDWKTSNYFSKDYALQVAAYAAAFAEQYNVPLPKKCYIVKFAKTDAIYEIKEVEDVPNTFLAFLAAKKLKDTLDGDVYKVEEYEYEV